MLSKIAPLYKNSILSKHKPEQPSGDVFNFYDQTSDEWLSIPKKEIGGRELQLLKTMYMLMESSPAHSPAGGHWHQFLYFNGPTPPHTAEKAYRLIQFEIDGHDFDHLELESALKGFFSDDVTIIWESHEKGIVIEEKKQISLSEEEFISMIETIESDFYIKFYLYIGKLQQLPEDLRRRFKQEREFLSFAIANIRDTHVFSYERVFPAYLAYHLPEVLRKEINQDILELFRQDSELLSTIKVFLENNLNASLTAKKLYIHRNTLQYRLDKFTEKTGINLKDFYGAFTVFLACQLFELQN